MRVEVHSATANTTGAPASIDDDSDTDVADDVMNTDEDDSCSYDDDDEGDGPSVNTVISDTTTTAYCDDNGNPIIESHGSHKPHPNPEPPPFLPLNYDASSPRHSNKHRKGKKSDEGVSSGSNREAQHSTAAHASPKRCHNSSKLAAPGEEKCYVPSIHQTISPSRPIIPTGGPPRKPPRQNAVYIKGMYSYIC